MSVFEEAWKELEEGFKSMPATTLVGVRHILMAMECALSAARQRVKEYQKELEKKLDEAEDRQQKDWLEEQGD